MQNFAFPYARASTDKQTLSVPAQLHAIKDRYDQDFDAGRIKIPLHEAFIDSATSTKIPFVDRPYGRALNERLQRGDVVYCAMQDRMFRNLREALNVMYEFQERGVALIIMDNPFACDFGSPVGEFAFSVLGAANSMERRYISIRTREALAERKRTKGPIFNGVPPLGWVAVKTKKGNRFIICEPERAFGLACHLLSTYHLLSYDTIGTVLSHLGIEGRANRSQVKIVWRFIDAHKAGYPCRGEVTPLKDYEIERVERAANHIVLRVMQSAATRDRFWPSYALSRFAGRPCFSTVSP